MVVDVVNVLHEERSEEDYFVALVEDGVEYVVHGCCCAYGHADCGCVYCDGGFFGTLLGDSGAGCFVAAVAHVAVAARDVFFDDCLEGVFYFLWRFEVRVADGEIENVLCAVDGFALVAFLEHFSDERA